MDAPKVDHRNVEGNAEGDAEGKAWTGREPLAEIDPDVLAIIQKEKHRQTSGLELIASEVRGQRD